MIPATKQMPTKPKHILGLVIFVCLLGFLAITKGWLAFFFLPLLLVLTPILFITQIWTNNVCRRQQEWPARKQLMSLAQWQLLSLFWAFLIAPGLWDTPEMMLFGVIRVPDNALWTALATGITIISFAVFLCVSVWQFILLFKARRNQNKKAS